MKRSLVTWLKLACLSVFVSSGTSVVLADDAPERAEPQYGGTVNILTRLAALNALSFNQYD